MVVDDDPAWPDLFAAEAAGLMRRFPNAPEEVGGKPLNDAIKYVASRTRPRLEWNKSVLIEGDAAEGVALLKRQDGPEMQMYGSGSLVQTLMRHGLVDRTGCGSSRWSSARGSACLPTAPSRVR